LYIQLLLYSSIEQKLKGFEVMSNAFNDFLELVQLYARSDIGIC